MDILGTPAGSIGGITSVSLKNDYDTIPSNGFDRAISDSRIQPRQVATGVTRGTWRINNTDGSYITIGLIPDTEGEFGIAFFDPNGTLISKNLGPAQTIFDSDGDELVTVDGTGFLLSFADERRIKLGLKPDASDVGFYLTPAGRDVIDELEA